MADHLVYPYDYATATHPCTLHMLGVCVAEVLIITTRPTQYSTQHPGDRCSLSGVVMQRCGNRQQCVSVSDVDSDQDMNQGR